MLFLIAVSTLGAYAHTYAPVDTDLTAEVEHRALTFEVAYPCFEVLRTSPMTPCAPSCPQGRTSVTRGTPTGFGSTPKRECSSRPPKVRTYPMYKDGSVTWYMVAVRNETIRRLYERPNEEALWEDALLGILHI